MSSLKNNKELHYNFYRVAQGDSFDIGFRIRGFEFRFINPRKQERSQERPWKFLTKDALPEAFVKELEKTRPGFFGSDGLHRRMGENILAFCPTDAYADSKKDLASRNREDLERIVGKHRLTRDVTTESEFEAVPVQDLSDNFKK